MDRRLQYTVSPSLLADGVLDAFFDLSFIDVAPYFDCFSLDFTRLTVWGVNEPPTIDSIVADEMGGEIVVYEGNSLLIEVYASDPEGSSLTLSTGTLPDNASFVDNGNSTGALWFTPDYTQGGGPMSGDTKQYKIWFYATDATGLIDSAAAYVRVVHSNPPPVLEPIGPKSVTEGQLLAFTVYASDPDTATPTLSASNLPASAWFTDNLNGTGSFSWTPVSTQIGTHYVTFTAADGEYDYDEGPQRDSEVVAITVFIAACPDLRPSSFTLSGSQEAAPGEALKPRLSAEVENIGDAAAGSFGVGFYISSDDNITTSDQLLIGGFEGVSGVSAGGTASVPINGSMTIPAEWPGGQAYLGVVVDWSNSVDECDENNNTAAIPIIIVTNQPQVLATSIDGDSAVQNVTNHVPTIRWDYFDPGADNPQTQFEIAVGTDDDWLHAEMWNPVPFQTSDTFVTYAGETLMDGETYYLRLRVNNGFAWSDWYYTSFRMNSVPSVPVPLSPINDEYTGDMPTLWVENASDAEGDMLVYDFSGFHDTDCVAGAGIDLAGVPEEPDSTGGQITAPLGENCKHWWRARSFDGYEYSDWSLYETFFVNGMFEPPSAPQAQYPPDTSGLPVFDMLTYFYWSPSTDADPLDTIHYKLEIAVDSMFNFVYTVDSIAAPPYTLIDSLAFGTHYWWCWLSITHK